MRCFNKRFILKGDKMNKEQYEQMIKEQYERFALQVINQEYSGRIALFQFAADNIQ